MANIFVIDDNGTVREGVSAVLEKAGHRVTSFTGGKLAIEEFAKRPDDIDMVITSVHWLHRLVLRAGSGVTVLAPAHLVGIHSDAAQAVLARYSETTSGN